jgi:hypothetical protein
MSEEEAKPAVGMAFLMMLGLFGVFILFCGGFAASTDGSDWDGYSKCHSACCDADAAQFGATGCLNDVVERKCRETCRKKHIKE